jgi:hypothetical protein
MRDTTVKTAKGFDENMICKGYQFKFGKTFIHDGPIKLCRLGFHSCENPIDVFRYYPPGQSRYSESEASGTIVKHNINSSKMASSEIKIGAELSIKSIVDKSIEYIFKKCVSKKENHSTGPESASSATGHRSASSATGHRSASSATDYRSVSSVTGVGSASSAAGLGSASSATGYGSVSSVTGPESTSSVTGYGSASSAIGPRSTSSVTGYGSASSATGPGSASSATGFKSASSAAGPGSASITTGNMSTASIINSDNIVSKNAIAIGFGIDNRAKAPLGCWIALSEWKRNASWEWQLCSVECRKVDGEQIKADTWYKLSDNKFVIAE